MGQAFSLQGEAQNRREQRNEKNAVQESSCSRLDAVPVQSALFFIA